MVNLRAACVGVGGLMVMACALAGCGTSDRGVAHGTRPGVPDGLVVDPLDDEPIATWIERGQTFGIVTFGSGSCPPVATALVVEGPDHVAVTFGPSPNDPCTADISPTTHEFELPAEITRLPVVLEINYEDWPETDTLTLR